MTPRWVAAIAGIVAFGVATVVLLRKPAAPRDDAVRVYLTPWAGDAELVQVYTTALGTANPHGHGFTLHDGIAATTLAGDEAQTILIVHFREGVTGARRDSLLAGIRRSPLVTRID